MFSFILSFLVTYSTFNSQFIVSDTFNIPPEIRVSNEKGWTFWDFISVQNDGRAAAIIDPNEKEIYIYKLLKDEYSTLIEHGRKRTQVNLPLAINETSNKICVSDIGNRRITTINKDKGLYNSFLLPKDLLPPNELIIMSDGNYLLGGLRLDSMGVLNAGNYCNIYTPLGKLVNSFAYTPQASLDRYLWIGVTISLDIDTNENIYTVFSTEGIITVYTKEGKLIKKFNQLPDWFIPAPALPKPHFKRESEPPKFWQSWTRIIKLIYVNKYLLLVAETNNLVENCNKPFIIAKYSFNGQLLQPGILSDYFPFDKDSTNAIYFISLKGDKLIKAYLKERQ